MRQLLFTSFLFVVVMAALSDSEIRRIQSVLGLRLKNETRDTDVRRDSGSNAPKGDSGRRCIHDLLDATIAEHEKPVRREIDPPDSSLLTSPMSVEIVIEKLGAGETNFKQKNDLIENISNEVKKRFEELFRVVARTEPIEAADRTEKYCSLKGKFNADLVLHVFPENIEMENVLGFASSCKTDDYGRSVHGFFVVEKDQLIDANFVFLTGLFLHEATHVLGFSSAQYKNDLTTGKNGRTGFDFDSILKYGQDFFNCESLDIIEVENNGGSGTALSHFEKRVFMNEIMTGSSSQIPAYSKFTLLVLEHLGYYGINWDKADLFGFGYKRGCNFISECSKKTWGSLFCTENNLLGCSADLTGPGICNVVDNEGTDELADKCPYYLNYPDKSCAVERTSSSGETFGATSRCFMGSLLKGSPIAATRNGYCYQVECLSTTVLKLRVGDDMWVTCNSGDSQMVPGYAGLIECPTVARICAGVDLTTVIKFPVFESITPGSGGSGTRVTINGKNFNTNGMTVRIDSQKCENVDVKSTTELECTVGNVDFFSNIGSVISGKRRSVIIVDIESKLSDVGSGVFELSMSGRDVSQSIEHFFARYTFLAVCIIVSAVAFLALGAFLIKQCLFPKRRNYTIPDELEIELKNDENKGQNKKPKDSKKGEKERKK